MAADDRDRFRDDAVQEALRRIRADVTPVDDGMTATESIRAARDEDNAVSGANLARRLADDDAQSEYDTSPALRDLLADAAASRTVRRTRERREE